jgi:hypothetical protein
VRRIRRNASRVGIVERATKKKILRLETKYPSKPIEMAATTLPAELNDWLRPCRASKRWWPTIPSEMAQMAGAKILEVAPISTWADITAQNVGTNATSNAPRASAPTAPAIRVRLAWI